MRGDGHVTLGLGTRITAGAVVSCFGAVYWLITLGSRVDAAELRASRAERETLELKDTIIKRLDDINDAQIKMSVDIAGIEARLALLVEWTDLNRKRSNQRP